VTEAQLADIDDAVAPIVAAFQHAATVSILPYLRPEHAERLERELIIPVRDAINEVIARIAQLELEIEGQSAGGAEWDEVLEPTRDDAAPQIGRMLNDELWQQVADVCFAARGELRRAERGIRHGGASHDDRLAACEGAYRKLRRALGAVLGSLGRARDRTFPVLAELGAEVESAVAIRRMYAKFRRSLPACDPGQPSSVRRALRYAAVSLAVMVGSTDFGDVRTADRALLLRLQSRIMRWARDGASDGDGARLYQDVLTTADLLRSINMRQELAAHDQRMLRDAADALAAGDPAAAISAAAPALRALDGRDDWLDAALERALREPPGRALVAELRAAVAAAAGDRDAASEAAAE
jgi:hypothetical protein